MEFNSKDYRFMSHALQLAKRGLYTTQPNPRVGCVIVQGDQIVGEGFHRCAGEPHAEIHALKAAGEQAKNATAYVSLEPCSHHGRTPPCSDALISAHVGRVIVAMKDPNPQVSGSGIARLREAGIQVDIGLMQAEAETLNPGFIKRMRMGLPWVRVKMAMSLDGRTAMASGESKWITSEAARFDVQKFRARSSAILTGMNTVAHDDPSMNVRLNAETLGIKVDPIQPLRVVLDTSLRTPVAAKIVQHAGKIAIFYNKENSHKKSQLQIEGVFLHKVSLQNGQLDLNQIMQVLGQYEVNECHVECGAKLAGSLLKSGLVDEMIIYMAPHIMGADACGLFQLPGLKKMSERIQIDIKEIRKVGEDWRITSTPVY